MATTEIGSSHGSDSLHLLVKERNGSGLFQHLFLLFLLPSFPEWYKKYKTVLSTYESKIYKYPKAINESKRLPEISIVFSALYYDV